MIRVEPTNTITLKANRNKPKVNRRESDDNKNNNGLIVASLTALTALCLATVGLVKTRTTNFEEALKKAGVEIKDNIAKKIDSGEKFTGKIERFETRNKKEVIEYTDGIIKEKVYYNALGKELSGVFYKDGMPKVGVGNITKRGENAYYTVYEYNGENIISRGDAGGKANGSIFEKYRNLINIG